jgi:DNA-directed RNA polymerase specialized sigma24 family protein
VATQSDIARLLDEVVRLQALEVRKRAATQNEAIIDLSNAGIGPSRISELLGTTPGTVSVALAKARKRKSQKTETEP